jgi:hypothetical protein
MMIVLQPKASKDGTGFVLKDSRGTVYTSLQMEGS